jgi:hypothetical protein
MELRNLFVWVLPLFAIIFVQGCFADLTYGQGCNLNDESNLLCNPDEGLQCILGKCVCPSELSYHFNRTIKQCVGLAGTACEGPNSLTCHPGYSVCAPDSSSRTGFSCACTELHSSRFDRKCFRSKRKTNFVDLNRMN